MTNYSPSEQTLETIRAMRRQEELGYSVSDYLSCLPTAATALDTPIDASCRFAMAKWCNEIVDFCKYSRETVGIAMSCLDRFMCTASGQEILLNRNLYQLAAMTALYSSVKIHEQEAMDPKLVSELSQGIHSPQAVEAMEMKMLDAIQWRVNPPTAISFVRSMTDLLPDDIVQSCEKEIILAMAQQQIELIVNDYDFCTFDESSIALACMLNAIESATENGALFSNFEAAAGLIISGTDHVLVRDLRIAIYELIHGDDGCPGGVPIHGETTSGAKEQQCGSPGAVAAATDRNNSFRSSPRSVATSVSRR